jgi:imidazolonepropionase-like amidohydrolase
VLALGEEALEAGAERLDLTGLWLTAAPLDVHVHLHLGGAVEANLEAHRAAGVVAVREMGHKVGKVTPVTVGQGPPLVRAAGVGLGAVGEGANWLAEGLAGPEAFGRAARARAEAGAGVLKVFGTGLLDSANPGKVHAPQAVSLEELRAVVEVGRAAGLPVAVHGSGLAAARACLETGVSSLEHGFFLDRDTLEAMSKSSLVWVPTLAPVKGHMLDAQGRHAPQVRENWSAIYEGQLKALALAAELGVKLALGTDAGSYGVPHGQGIFAEMACWLEAGLPPQLVYQAATSDAARLMGLGGELGVLAPGARAWLLGVAGDPEQNPLLLGQAAWRSF